MSIPSVYEYRVQISCPSFRSVYQSASCCPPSSTTIIEDLVLTPSVAMTTTCAHLKHAYENVVECCDATDDNAPQDFLIQGSASCEALLCGLPPVPSPLPPPLPPLPPPSPPPPPLIDVTLQYLNQDPVNISTSGSITRDYDDSSPAFVTEVTVDGTREMEIKGRGHSTWQMGEVWGKYPYQLKFKKSTEPKSMLGMPDERKWVFLQNLADKTYMRNAIVFEMGHTSSLAWTPSSRFANVTLNGDGIGLYQITEKVEVSTNRVDLPTYDDESEEPFGFLLEIDTLRGDMEWDPEEHPTDWLGTDPWGSKWIIKEPELDPDKQEEMDHVDALRTYLASFETALENQEWSTVSSMIDVDSFVDWFLINEIAANVDARHFSSIYFQVTAPPDRKIRMGPLWDFDLAFGNARYSDAQYANLWWISKPDTGHPWITRLMQWPLFKEAVTTRFVTHFYARKQITLGLMQDYKNALEPYAEADNQLYNHFGSEILGWLRAPVYATYADAVADLVNWYDIRMEWMNTELNIIDDPAITVSVTFRVFLGQLAPHRDGVFLAGGDLGQTGHAMSHVGDGVWSVTIDLEKNRRYLYKFRNRPSYGTWSGFESSSALGGCSDGQWNDRFVDVSEIDVELPVVRYGSCETINVDEIRACPDPVAIDSNQWFHQTRLPNGWSWYNGEQQHYTNELENSYTSEGTLKIVAKHQTYTDQGHTKQYTSARLNSKYAFKYGRVSVRAKLGPGHDVYGAWPAIWTLGKNISEPGAYWQTQGYGTTGWPACGEIDIMEHWGKSSGIVKHALHTPSSNGNTVNFHDTLLGADVTAFHLYEMEWDEEKIRFFIDGVQTYVYNPTIKNSATWPFDDNGGQYVLLNVAVESVAALPFESTMEIDYVRIYDLDGNPLWNDEFTCPNYASCLSCP